METKKVTFAQKTWNTACDLFWFTLLSGAVMFGFLGSWSKWANKHLEASRQLRQNALTNLAKGGGE